MQEVSFDDLVLDDVATVTAEKPEEVSFDDIVLEEVTPEPTQTLGPIQGPRPERNIDRVRQAKEQVRVVGGSYQEQMEVAQKASTEFKIE